MVKVAFNLLRILFNTKKLLSTVVKAALYQQMSKLNKFLVRILLRWK